MSKRSIIVPCINGAIALLMAFVVFAIQWRDAVHVALRATAPRRR